MGCVIVQTRDAGSEKYSCETGMRGGVCGEVRWGVGWGRSKLARPDSGSHFAGEGVEGARCLEPT